MSIEPRPGLATRTAPRTRSSAEEELSHPHAVDRFVTPAEFQSYAAIGRAKGFGMVAASPLTRSSHHAGEDFARLKAARAGA